MKANRHAAILDLIEKQSIETQEELASALRERGIAVTQATVSRDIKELRLVKVLAEDNSYRYASASKEERGMVDRFARIFSESVLSVDYAGNMVVIKTLTGSANAAAEAIDTAHWQEVVGSLAGDNTILVIIKHAEAVPEIVRRFRAMMK